VRITFTLGLTAALLVSAATAQAQGIAVGLRAGVNVANLSFSSETEVVDSKNLTGFVGGLFVTVPVNEIVAFQPEVLFSMQGTKFTDGGQSAKVKLDYVQTPLLLHLKPGAKSPIALLVGPTLGFRSRAELEVPGAPIEFTNAFEDEVKGFDMGLVAGAALELGSLVLDGRYTWGLMNISKDSNDPGTAKNRVFSATVGVRF
jgi:Outer membrane protein beta-barrel domain